MPVINTIAVIMSLALLISIVYLIHRRIFRERYSLIWLLAGGIGFIVSASPDLVNAICKVLGVTIPLNLLLFLAVIFLTGVCIMLTAVVSRQAGRIEKLAKELALMERAIP